MCRCSFRMCLLSGCHEKQEIIIYRCKQFLSLSLSKLDTSLMFTSTERRRRAAALQRGGPDGHRGGALGVIHGGERSGDHGGGAPNGIHGGCSYGGCLIRWGRTRFSRCSSCMFQLWFCDVAAVIWWCFDNNFCVFLCFTCDFCDVATAFLHRQLILDVARVIFVCCRCYFFDVSLIRAQTRLPSASECCMKQVLDAAPGIFSETDRTIFSNNFWCCRCSFLMFRSPISMLQLSVLSHRTSGR